MKKTILPFSIFAVMSLSAVAQSNRLFAITGDAQGSVQWNAIREVNFADGKAQKTIYAPSTKQPFKYLSVFNTPLNAKVIDKEPTYTNVAATAYDATNNRLYFANMQGSELRYVDLTQPELTVVTNDDANFSIKNKVAGEGSVITRMTFGVDGYGYALTNDGEHLMRFTTGNNPIIEDLGALVEGKVAADHSFKNQCSGWGGDLVGAVNGDLYLFTVRGNVFKINVANKVTDFVGQVKGLPADFTINGAAATEDGHLLVGGSNYTKSYFKVNIETLQTIAPVTTPNGVYNASDLASANLLFQSKLTDNSRLINSSNIKIFPNPVVNKRISATFNNLVSGDYVVAIESVSGKLVSKNKLSVVRGQTLNIALPQVNNGVYYLKVIGSNQQAIAVQKLVVE